MTKVLKGWFDVFVQHKNTESSSRMFGCDKVDYIADKEEGHFDHHLMFYRDGKLIFKVWLKNGEKDKPYKSVEEAMKDVGMSIYRFE